MKFKEKYEIDREFASIFDFKSESDELKHDAYILMFKFLSEIERATEDTLHNKDLAKALDSSRSFVSQLFKGNKLANLLTFAKLQKSYDLVFEVKAIPNKSNIISIGPNVDNNIYKYPANEFNDNHYDNNLTFVYGAKTSHMQLVS